MRILRFARDLRALQGTYKDLAAEAARADDEASYRLTLTARGFARRSRKVVDDKLSFSATLMRAGEVHAANRLLDEVQTEVRTEEAALMEQVNEAKVAQAVRKDKMTRLRFVRMVAVALMGSMLMGLSAVGMAAVSYFDARDRDGLRETRNYLKVLSVEHELEATKLARKLAGSKDHRVEGILLKLSLADLRTLEKLTDEGVGPTELERFLVAALPTAELARELTHSIVGTVASTPVAAAPVVEKVASDGVAVLTRAKRKAKEEAAAKEEAQDAEQTEAEPTEEPADDETPAADEKKKDDDPSSSPSPLPQNGPFSGGSSDKDGEEGLLD